METVNVLNQMAEYDFNAPINVEMIFEDGDDDEPSLHCEQENINNNSNNKQFPDGKCETNSKKSNQISENLINNLSLNKSMISLNKNSRNLQRKLSQEKNQDNEKNNLNNRKDAKIRKNTNDVEYNNNISDANQHTSVLINHDTVSNEERLPSTRQMNDHHEPVTTFIEDLLKKISEHIILIMQSFYHYGVKMPNQDNKKREDIFNFIKYHFFELSYSTVESVLLPLELNETFINNFLDKTVLIAHNKSLTKCKKSDVLPFLKELLTWAKQKRENIRNQPSPSYENILLKQQLIRPPLPLNLPQSENVANSNIAMQKTQSNLCIFSSGPPGSEISINIDPKTLNQINERQQGTVTAEPNGNNKTSSKSCKSTRRKTPVASPTYRNRVNDIQKNNPKYDRPPPPAYHTSHSTNISPYRQQQSSYSCSRIGPPHQNQQSIRQPFHNYPTQNNYINTNHTSPHHENNLNYLYNTNNNIPMHRTQIENQITSTRPPSTRPGIINVSSSKPNTQILVHRCYLCGKNTSVPCNPYNPPIRRYFCSYLCQELDSQFYKPTWSNT